MDKGEKAPLQDLGTTTRNMNSESPAYGRADNHFE